MNILTVFLNFKCVPFNIYVHASVLMNLISILMNLMDSLEFVPLYLQGPCFFQIGNNLIIDFTKKNQY